LTHADLNGAKVKRVPVVDGTTPGRICVELVDDASRKLSVKPENIVELPVAVVDSDTEIEDENKMAVATKMSPASTILDSDTEMDEEEGQQGGRRQGGAGSLMETEGAPLSASMAMKLAPASMLNRWSEETTKELVERSTRKKRRAKLTIFRSCTVVQVGERFYGVTIESDARGAQPQCEAAALKLGMLCGPSSNVSVGAACLDPSQRRRLELLEKLKARTTSNHTGEAANAQRLLASKLKQVDLAEMQAFIVSSVDEARAVRYRNQEWNAGSPRNKVTVTYLGEKHFTDFFCNLPKVAAGAHGCFSTRSKVQWHGGKHASASFFGLLSSALDAAFLSLLIADLAFSYADTLDRRQERLSGFLRGVALGNDLKSEKATQEAMEAAVKWHHIVQGRPHVKRSGAAFDEGKAAGQGVSLKRTRQLKDA
jgi:hypothetical protein